MSETNVYGITGESGAGKTTAANMMAAGDIEKIDLGPDIVKPLIDRITWHLDQIEEISEETAGLYEDPREWNKSRHIEELSNAYIWRHLEEELPSNPNEIEGVVVSGIRTPYIWEQLQEDYDAEMIEIQRDLTTKGQSPSNTITGEGINQKTEREKEMGIWYTTTDARHTIYNSNGYESLADDLMEIMGRENDEEFKAKMVNSVS